jgi:hypothetical protein
VDISANLPWVTVLPYVFLAACRKSMICRAPAICLIPVVVMHKLRANKLVDSFFFSRSVPWIVYDTMIVCRHLLIFLIRGCPKILFNDPSQPLAAAHAVERLGVVTLSHLSIAFPSSGWPSWRQEGGESNLLVVF